MISFLRHVVGTKGVLHSFERSAQVLTRYSMGRRRFARMMDCLGNHFRDGGIRVTLCVTASLLKDHVGFLKEFDRHGHEFAAHGFFHTDMKRKTATEQDKLVSRSYGSFSENGIEVHGFRCPYLSYNGDTVKALNASAFKWTSNDIIFWDDIGINAHEGLRKLDLLYSSLDYREALSLPGLIDGIVHIPITAPDDEMLYERHRIKDPGEITRIWMNVFGKTYERGEIFHLLFHPERFAYMEEAICMLYDCTRPAQPSVWMATLNEIADWWRRRSLSRWSLEKSSNGEYFYVLKAPARSTLLIKSTRGTKPFYKRYRTVEDAWGNGVFRFPTAKPGAHRIRITESTCSSFEDFLKEEGFIVERGRPEGDSLNLDYPDFDEKDRLRVLEAIDNSPHPLLRNWRWPDGKRSVFTVSSDVDSINVADFVKRFIYF